jgi:hypothetical protein
MIALGTFSTAEVGWRTHSSPGACSSEGAGAVAPAFRQAREKESIVLVIMLVVFAGT